MSRSDEDLAAIQLLAKRITRSMSWEGKGFVDPPVDASEFERWFTETMRLVEDYKNKWKKQRGIAAGYWLEDAKVATQAAREALVYHLANTRSDDFCGGAKFEEKE